MKLPLIAALTALLLVSACAKVGASKLNPFNWFQGSRPAATLAPKEGYVVVTDDRALIDQVLTLSVEPLPGGAIVRATGLPPTQGYFDAALIADNDGDPVDGVLTYRFVVSPPPTAAPVSTQASREITAAVYISDIVLAQVRQITVQGARDARSSSR